MEETTVRISPGNDTYPIHIGAGNLTCLGERIGEQNPTSLFIVYDENVEPHLGAVARSLESIGVEYGVLSIPPGENSKSIRQAQRLWQFLAEKRADRRSIVIALGGGVTGDLAGFVAATFARGIRFYQVPTTLLAHVDSSVGGKTGINLPGAKNMVGAFWQPVGVLIDLDTLSTLPQREYLSGMAEVIKYGLIMDEPFFDKLESSAGMLRDRDPETLADTIAHCCRLKARVVEEDEKETTGRRAILNYGHTFAHAFEARFGYGEMLHGEAVAVGMLCAGELARRLGRVDTAFCNRQHAILQDIGLPTTIPNCNPHELIEIMRRDKKNSGNVIRFVLPTGIGQVELINEPLETGIVVESLQQLMQ